ncbi:MAG: tetratricopeptide repeat protein [Fervidobacterium sp.]|nr:tetratricopeptide repeat protein [Fervidobacterium sp.]
MNYIKAIVYLPLKVDVAKRLNLPVKLPVLAEDLLLITDQDNIPIDVVIRGLEEQCKIEKSDYWLSYLVYFYYEKFKIALNEKDFSAAHQLLSKAKELQYDYRYHFYNALLQSRLGNYEIAEIELKQSLGLNPDFSLAYYELGNILFIQKDYEDAIEAYKKAYQMEPTFLLPLLKIGDIYMELNQLDDAEIVYKSIISKDTLHRYSTREGLEIAPIPEAYLRLGVVYNLRQQFDKAEEIFKLGLNVGKKAEISYNLAYTLTRLGKHLEAYKVLFDLAKEYRSPEVLNELGILQRRLGLYEEAYKTFEEIQEQFPENFERIQYFVGEKNFESEYENELKRSENVLERIEFPFQDQLNLIIESTDDDGNILIDKFAELTGLVIAPQDNNQPKSEHFPYIFAGMYIAGTQPIVMEKNATILTVATLGTGLPIACTTAILRLYQYILSGLHNIDHFIEEIYPEIEELHFDFARKLLSLTEQPLDNFFDVASENYEDLALNIIRAVGYFPTAEEIENIKDSILRNTVAFLVSIMKNVI